MIVGFVFGWVCASVACFSRQGENLYVNPFKIWKKKDFFFCVGGGDEVDGGDGVDGGVREHYFKLKARLVIVIFFYLEVLEISNLGSYAK